MQIANAVFALQVMLLCSGVARVYCALGQEIFLRPVNKN